MKVSQEVNQSEIKEAISNIKQNVKDILKSQNIKNTSLAKKTDFSPSYVSQLLSGSRDFSLEALIRISKALNVSIDYLLGFRNEQSTDPNIEMICNYTNLSEKAVENLHSTLPVESKAGTLFYTNALNMILEADNEKTSFRDFLKIIFQCLMIEESLICAERETEYNNKELKRIEKIFDKYDEETDGAFSDLLTLLMCLNHYRFYYTEEMKLLIEEKGFLASDKTVRKIEELFYEFEQRMLETEKKIKEISKEIECKFPKFDAVSFIQKYITLLENKNIISNDIESETIIKEAEYSRLREYIHYVASTSNDIITSRMINDIKNRNKHQFDSFEHYIASILK